jgi:predicted Rdx family selenoprotein
MPKFLIERTIPGAGQFTDDEVRAISQKSNEVLTTMAPRVQWLHSYVTDDGIHCVYIADDEGTVLEHARSGGFPADKIRRVRRVIDPVTAELDA